MSRAEGHGLPGQPTARHARPEITRCHPANTRITPVTQPTPESRPSHSRHQNHACHPANTRITPVTQPTLESRLSPSQYQNHACHLANTRTTRFSNCRRSHPYCRQSQSTRCHGDHGGIIPKAARGSGRSGFPWRSARELRVVSTSVRSESAQLTRSTSANLQQSKTVREGGQLPSACIVRRQSL